MVIKIKPNEIVENKDVKSFYEKQEELINEIRESIKVNGLRNPLVINKENVLLDGYLRRDVLLELGKGDDEIDVILTNTETSLEDYILRNSGRTKTDNDLVKEWKYIFFKKYEKRQGRKRMENQKEHMQRMYLGIWVVDSKMTRPLIKLDSV